jgi:hypothetical protein
MRIEATVVLYFALMAAIVAAVDFLFFRNQFWERLIVNTGIVLVFAAFYLRFLKRPWRRDGVVIAATALLQDDLTARQRAATTVNDRITLLPTYQPTKAA